MSIILIIVLVLFGANRLPQLGDGLGKAMRGFKIGVADDSSEVTAGQNKSEIVT